MREDKAEDGNKILRYVQSSDEKAYKANMGVIKVIVKDNETKEVLYEESSSYHKGIEEYVNVYDSEELVKNYEENILTSMGEVIASGISYYSAFDAENSSDYKKMLEQALTRWKIEEVNNETKAPIMNMSDDGR